MRLRNATFVFVLAAAGASCSGDPGVGGEPDANTSRDRDIGRAPADIGGGDTDAAEPQAPIAVAGDDFADVAGRPITFDGTASSDPDGEIVAWRWSFGDGSDGSGATVTHTFAAEGVYEVTLTVTDDDGLTDTDTLLLDLVEANTAPVASITGPDEVVVGELERWRGDGSTDDIGITAWSWTTGEDDVDPIDGAVLEYAWAEWGTYDLVLTVTDTDGIEDSATLPVRALAPPVAVIDAPPRADERAEVAFDGTGSFDPDEGSVVSYAWDFDDGTTATGPLPRHAFALPGDYDVVLTVTDDDDLIGATVHKVTVGALPNESPVAVLGAGRTDVQTGDAIAFTGVDSYDPDGSLVRYGWTFGDGGALAGDEVTWSYDDDGSYEVVLTVTDDEGATGTDTVSITVGNRAPTARFTAPAQVVRGRLATFDASTSSDPDGSVVSWRWTFGTLVETVDTPTFAWSFVDHGLAEVSLIAVDDDGAASAPFPLTVEVLAPPTAVIEGPTTAVVGDEIELDGSGSTDPDGTIVAWDWDFGDGGRSSAPAPTRTFAEGTYDVTLTVTDDDGLTASTSVEISVTAAPNEPPVAVIDVANTRVDTGENVLLFAGSSFDPDGVISSYRWDFGDGATATGPDAGHAWDDDGIYTVTLTVTDGFGATDSDTVDVTVRNRAPIAAISAPVAVGVGESAAISGAASVDEDGRVVAWRWDLGDGTVTDGAIPTVNHTWTTAGTYTVTLVVTDDDGLESTPTTRTVAVRTEPIARIDAPPTAFVDDDVTFDGTGSVDPDGSIVAWRWSFPDGTTATGPTTTRAFATPGARDVVLRVTDDDGLIDETTHRVTVAARVNEAPIAVASADPTTVLTGVDVRLSSEGSRDPDGTLVGWDWDFGDGTTSSFPTPTHAWADDGVWEVTLTVTDDEGARASTSVEVTVNNRPPTPVLFGPSSVLFGATADFSAAASSDADGTIVTYTWDDGTGPFVGESAESFAWATPGPRVVTLTVTDDDGATATTTANVDVRARPSADFDVPSTGTAGIPVAFDGSPSSDPDGTIVLYAWTFGDGDSANGATTTHVYDAAGTYTVGLTVTDDDGLTDTITTNITIAAPVNQPPVAVASASPLTAATDAAVRFDSVGSNDPDGTIVSYAWDFGDGATGAGVSPTHRYDDDGTWVATLTVTDDRGGIGTDTVTVTITNRPPVAAVSGPLTTTTNTNTVFSAASSSDPDGTVVGWRWDNGATAPFDGAASASLRWATHGTYTVRVTVTDDDGATASATTPVTVQAPPVADIAAPVTATTGEAITLDGTGSTDPDGTISSWAWESGDGRDRAGSSASISYPTAGSYVVRLVVTDEDGLTDEATHTITVSDATNLPPTSRPSADTVFTQTGTVIRFDSTASSDPDGVIVAWLWDFGDGTSSPAPNPTHIFADDGIYLVQLTVFDDRGASHTSAVQIEIENRPPVAVIAEVTPGGVGNVTAFDGTGSSDPDGSVVSWNWDFGDGSTSFGDEIGHVYASEGVYTVTLTVTDDDGATGVTTQVVRISDRIDYVGTWDIPDISYSCVDNFFGFPAITLNIPTLSISGPRPSISVIGPTMPVAMTGSVSGNTIDSAIGINSGGCTETYAVTGEFLDANTDDLTLTLTLTGSQCSLTNCTNQSWDVTATR